MPKQKFDNPVVENYKGRVLHRYQTIKIRVNTFTAKKFIDLHDEHAFSAKEVLQMLTTPCERCKNISIIAYDKDGNQVEIPRNILNGVRK